MANMSYCRFENTLRDLQDVHEHLQDDDLSKDEARARKNLVRLCVRIVDEFSLDEPESQASKHCDAGAMNDLRFGTEADRGE